MLKPQADASTLNTHMACTFPGSEPHRDSVSKGLNQLIRDRGYRRRSNIKLPLNFGEVLRHGPRVGSLCRGGTPEAKGRGISHVTAGVAEKYLRQHAKTIFPKGRK